MGETGPGIVLVIENDRDTRELFDFTLTGAGFRCVTAANAEETLRQAAVVRFDAILMDLGLPRLEDGLALARQLRERPLPSPIIAVSGHLLPAGPARELFAAYILKPIDPEQLVTIVREVVGPRTT
jgi:CheY-like chemotaxis protein